MSGPVLLVSDIWEGDPSAPSETVFEEDMPMLQEVEDISVWLRTAGYDVQIEKRVSSLLGSYSLSRFGIVFPLWRAGSSRNRTAIVPAICEEQGVPYIGGDALVQAACQDKSLSKAFIREAGLSCPQDFVVRSVEDIPSLQLPSNLKPPVVVKPLYSACSIGVDDTSLCRSVLQIRDKAVQLFQAGLGPVICEEFVGGDEVCLCIVEESGKIIARCASAYRGSDGKCPFADDLLTFERKIQPYPPWSITDVSSSVSDEIWSGVGKLVKNLGKVDLLRVDGRLQNGRFIVVELTPDIHLGTASPFLGGFQASGIEPRFVLDVVVKSSLANQRKSLAFS